MHHAMMSSLQVFNCQMWHLYVPAKERWAGGIDTAQSLQLLLAKECASSLEAAGMGAQSAEEPEPAASPAAPAASPARKSFELADL